MEAGSDAIDAAAAALREAHATGTPIPPLRHGLPAGDVATAYAVQARNTTEWIGAGRRPVGRKIGLTSPAVQQQLGVDQPDFGMLYADMCLSDTEPVPAGAVLQPRVEAEVAIVLGDDLPHPDTTAADLLSAIDYLVPAIEVVGSRIQGWDIDIVDTIADNASSGAFVLGSRPVSPQRIDLREAGMVLTVDGAPRSEGSGAACLGHPYRAAVWLARQMAEVGSPLLAGDVILTGALGPMVDLVPGPEIVATIVGLGTVRTSLEQA